MEGSTLPTGQNNIHANYRIGSGLSGNVAAGSITTLMDRPLGVSGVNNPQAATGGQDAQSVDDIRANAPLSVLTLGRAVSITDYQNFARSFAGIAKAYAIWIPSGPGRGVFITVAAAGGSALPPGNPTLDNLVTALHDYGNPLIPIHVQSVPRDAVQLQRRHQVRPGLRRSDGEGRACSTSCARATASARALSGRAYRRTRSRRSSRTYRA